jgi:hypothetical protein
MLLNSRPKSLELLLTVAAFLLTLAAAAPVCAQSSEANFPTPVFSGELSGRIAPRDLGDPRRTRHFYIFRGTEGDLVVNLEANELLGDVDVFLAAGFRPLLKFTVLGDPARLTKSFYLRKEETLVLRVEARAVGDVEATYRVTFGGSFLPAPPELANQTPPEAPTVSSAERRGGGTRRVTATGARIEEPKPEPTPAVEAATAEPTPTPTPRTAGRRTTTNRRGRNTRPAPSRPRPSESATQPTAPESTEAKPPEEAAVAPTPAPTPAPSSRRRPARNPRRGSTRGSSETSRAEPPAQPAAAQPAPTPAPAPAPTQRLIIVTKDGETLERDMSAVRRVTVENNQVVIVGRDGKVTRRPLASILKMSIEP